jgi:hypothetical protein
MDLPPMATADKDRQRMTDELKRFTTHLPQGLPIDLRVPPAPDVHQEILA